jgi:CubicO group peptidase (beta-lactamase class C family)
MGNETNKNFANFLRSKFHRRKHRFYFSVLFLFILAFAVTKSTAAPVPCQGSDPKHALDGLRQFITAEMQKAKLPGLAMAVVQNGKLLCAEGFGLRDVEHNLPVTTQTLFGIGSTSKSFTALAMGILNDQGKLDWDKPVRQYLPEFQMYDPVASERMTPRDLIAHRAGFPRHDLLWYSSDFTREDLVRRLRYLQSDHDFRSGYRYNNLLVATAGYMAGKIVGSTWEDLVRQRILLPLKMNNTNFSITDTQRSPDFSYPYKKDEKTGTVSRIPFHSTEGIGPAGSINSNVEDISNYLILQLGKGKFSGQQIVSEANLNLMHSPQTAMPASLLYRELGQLSYGMGWVVTAYRGHRYIWHNGGIDGFYSLIAMLPDDDLGVVVFTNILGNHQIPEIVAYNIFDRVLGLPPIDWSSRFEQQREKAKKNSR